MTPRLESQADGYADYADYVDQPYASQSQGPGQYPGEYGTAPGQPGRGRETGRTGYAGRRRKDHRGDRTARQRSIRSTITVLLIIPLLSLIALWAYAASSTVGGALAKQTSDTINREFGAPTQALVQQLDTERADTFAWQSARGRMPRTALDAQRVRTDAAIAAFRPAIATVVGQAPAAARPLAAALLGKLNHLTVVRAEVNAGTIAPLAAFEDYNAAGNAVNPFALALLGPEESLQLFQESQAEIEEGEAVADIAQEATLVGGVLASGGSMPATEYQLFVQTVDNQRIFEQIGDSPLDWQSNPDPFLPVFASPAFAGFQALENKIVAGRPGARLKVSPAAWEAGVGSVLAEFTPAQTAARLGVTSGFTHAGDIILLRLILVGGAGLLAVIVSSILLLGFGNRISRELTGLRGAARTLAGERLPSLVKRLRAGDDDVDVAAEAPPLKLGTKTREVTETADAFSVVQRTAVEAAVEQARLRKAVSLVFRSLARRNQSLLQRQLKLLDEMERGTEDADALAQLFRLDNLTTRMRRQAEGLIILSGAAPGRAWRQPVPLVEMLRGAVGEIEDFARVDLVTDSPDFMQGTAVANVTHMLAELVENAVLYSPPSTRVQVRGGWVAYGYVIEIEDRGLGIPLDTLTVLNERLARPPEFDLVDSDQLGLFVVSSLAARHEVRVSLRSSEHGGTTAIVLLPHALVLAAAEVPAQAGRGARNTQAGRNGGMGRAAAPSAPRVTTAVAAQALAGRRPLRSERVLSQAAPTEGPAAGTARPARSAGTAGTVGTGSGLPRRERMASIAPQLRDDRPGTPKGPMPGRSPEQARSLMSAIQQGWRSGQAAPAPEDGGGPGEEENPGPLPDWSQS
jgi:signal transduction histidine kinase